jgi:outer membrane protein assembly factor BamB
MRTLTRAFVIVCVLIVLAHQSAVCPADWPTYQHDCARSAVTPEKLDFPLAEQWIYAACGEPITAWGDPKPVAIEGNLERPRARFDDAYHVALAGGAVYFGTSCDDKVYCLDAATGKQRWSAFTGGPIRLAPTIQDGRVYVGSDDGYIYCLDARDGKLVWRFQAAPEGDRLLARGKMTSLWPPRTGVLVEDGVAYFSAGVFPGERVYLYAARADDGSLIWKNDTVSDVNAGQHGFSPQGYLLASEDTLYVPSGRTIPAAFDRETGRFLFQRSYGWRSVGQVGGTYALLAGDQLYSGANDIFAYDKTSGNIGFAWFPGLRLVVTSDVSYMLSEDGVAALNRQDYPALSRKRRELATKRTSLQSSKPDDLEEQLKALDEEEKTNEAALTACHLWQVPGSGLESMIVAGDAVLVGGEGEVKALNATTGDELWTGKVTGKVEGMAVADGRLLVSTGTGTIHCFAPGQPQLTAAAAAHVGTPYPDDKLAPVYEAAAERIVKETRIEDGFCLVLGCGEGRLTYELAKRTELRIYGVDPDAAKVEQARRAMDVAGLYGTRVRIEQADLADLPYSDYFANLIVSDEALVSGRLRAPAAEAYRVLKPVGGTICVGQPDEAEDVTKPLKASAVRQWLKNMDGGEVEVSEDDGVWGKLVRGSIEGAGSWTHQYGEPGNTAASDDTALSCPLGVLWYGDPGPDFAVNRHAGAAAPLSINGRVYLQGENEIICFDAYNGVQYWKRSVPGAYRVGMVRECGNLAATHDSLFVAAGNKCLRLDAQDGSTQSTYELPKAPDGGDRRWAYVAVVGDTLFGSASAKSQQSDAVFALAIGTGEHKWVHNGTNIRNNTIAISEGRMFFADAAATSEQRQEALKDKVEELKAKKGIDGAAAEKELESADVRLAVALDAGTGDKLWERPIDLTDCGAHVLSAIAAKGCVAFCGSHNNGHFWPQFLGGEYGNRRVTVLSASDGSLLWTKAIGYRIRPLVVGDTLVAEPWAFDLRTGKQKMRTHPLTGRSSIWQFERPGHHCGTISGSPNGLYFRSGSIGYYDLTRDYGANHFAGQRPGCWINLLPANGLLVAPEASSGCVCLYSITCTTVFKPREQTKAWGLCNAPGDTTPVKQMCINLGGPGDRRDDSGNLWLGYPRPGGRMILKFALGLANLPGGGYFSKAAEHVAVTATDAPWLFASGCSAITKCTIPLVGEGDGAAVYKVRLAFADAENSKPGERVFDIKLQDKLVAKDFDIVKAAGGPNKAAFKEFGGIEVYDDLKIEFVPKATDSPPEEAPLLNGLQIVRERVLSLGVSTPSFLLSDLDSEQTADFQVANARDEEFLGRLRLSAPKGFSVTPAETEVRVAPNSRQSIPVKVAVAQKGSPADIEIGVTLLREDGSTEAKRTAALTYLGPRGRVVATPVEDTYVQRGQPTQNFGHHGTLAVDGGDQAMGDRSHGIAYLKFVVDVPGKSVSVKFRIHTTPAEHSQSGDSGTIHLVDAQWDENKLNYADRPQPGRKIGTLGEVGNNVWEERELDIELSGKTELTLVLEPTSTDGASYHSREGTHPPELVIEYEPGG